MTHRIKSVVKRALAMPGIREPFRWMVRDHAIIFMLHRFADEANGVRGMDPNSLREFLGRIYAQRLRVVSLDQLFDELASGKSVTGSRPHLRRRRLIAPSHYACHPSARNTRCRSCGQTCRAGLPCCASAPRRRPGCCSVSTISSGSGWRRIGGATYAGTGPTRW